MGAFKGNPDLARQAGSKSSRKGIGNKNKVLISTVCNYLVESGYERFKIEFEKLEGQQYVDAFLRLAKITTGDSLVANDKLIEFFNDKIKQNGNQ